MQGVAKGAALGTGPEKRVLRLRQVDRLSARQVDQLVDLFRMQDWSADREVGDVIRMLARTQHLYGFVDPADEALVGFARVMTDAVYKALVLDMIVRPDWRGSGLGRRILDAVIADPELASVKHFELYCPPEMAAFYADWGFERPGRDVFMRLVRTDRVEAGPRG